MGPQVRVSFWWLRVSAPSQLCKPVAALYSLVAAVGFRTLLVVLETTPSATVVFCFFQSCWSGEEVGAYWGWWCVACSLSFFPSPGLLRAVGRFGWVRGLMEGALAGSVG
jgi:hypothetical protein